MGQAMARNLMRAGHQLTVYNRTRAKAEPLAHEGAKIAGSPADAAAEADVLISMLADDHAVRATILNGQAGQRPAIETLQGIHMSSSSISVDLSKELEAAHRARGQRYIAAPILGRSEAAADKQVWVIAAGPRNDVAACRPLMDAIGHGVSEVGAEPWKANLVKIGVNFFLSSVIEALGEAFALIEKSGLDTKQFFQVLNECAFRSPVVANYGNMILDQRYQPAGFTLNLGLKDTLLALQAATAAQAPLPIAGVLHDQFLHAMAHGMGDRDWSAIAEVSRQTAGLRRTMPAGG